MGESAASLPLRHNREFLTAVLDYAGQPVLVLDRAARICLFNQACESLFGSPTGDVLGARIDRFLAPEERGEVKAVFADILAGNFPSEHENDFLTRSGRRHRIQWRNTALLDERGEVEYVVAIGLDVSDARRAEQKLRHSQEQLQRLIDSTPALVAKLDAGLHVRFANEAYRTWFGLDPGEIVGKHVREVIGSQALALLEPCFQEALRGRTAQYRGEVPYRHGGTRVIHGVYAPAGDLEGSPDGLFILAVDLTEQHRLANALAGQVERANAVLDTAIDGIITIDIDGIMQSANAAAERIFGYKERELIGRNVSMLMPESYRAHHDEHIRHYLETGEKRVIGVGREVQGLRRNGEVFPLELSVGEFIENGQRYFTGFTRDISDRRRAEEEARERTNQLAHVSRVSAMGDLASGLAHEVNQPLTAIVTTAQACLRLMDADRASMQLLRQSLSQVARQGERASDIIRGMRGFLRKVDEHPRSEEDVARLVRDALNLLQHEIRTGGIQVRLQFEPALPCVGMRRVQVEQVLLNLMRNAIEAMSETEGLRCLVIHAGLSRNGRAVQIRIEDNGAGIPMSVRERLFDPFVTSKPSGMGQGLSISRTIARAHGGDLELLHTGENGTSFVLHLPVGAAGGGRNA